MASGSAAASVPPMRLEPLTFVGYDRGGSGFVHVITPQGAIVRLRPSPPSHASTQKPVQQQQQQQLLPSATPRPPAAASKLPLPPPPPRPSSAAPNKAPAAAGKLSQPPSTIAIAAPPEGFEVEFVFSSSSSSSSSSRTSAAASRSSSRSPRESPAPAQNSADVPSLEHNHSNVNGSSTKKVEEQAELPSVSSTQEQVSTHKKQPREEPFPPHPALPPFMVHGAALSASAASRAELDAALTQCALVLFGGRLPQQQQQQQPAEDAAEPSPLQWSEAVNYHAATLLGFDEAGCAYVAAQSFAQPIPPPQHWRLCPLPVLVCATAAPLLRFFEEAAKAEMSEVRVPVLPGSVATEATAAGAGAGAADSSQDASRLPPPPPPPPPPSAPPRAAPPTTAAAAAAGAASGASCFLSPPLRWELPACGNAPALDLRRVFEVAPGRPYLLARHGEEVAVVGVALDVPWVRVVVPLPPAGRGVLAPPTANKAGVATVSPPEGFRWKDPRGWAEPLAGCHTAHDLRARHGLEVTVGVKESPDKTASVTATEAVPGAQAEEGKEVVPAEAVSSAPPPPRLASTTPTPTPPPVAAAAEPKAPPSSTTTATTPTFVKEGDVVFVPGRFGVLLECNAQPALLEQQCGLAHGDRVQARRAGVASAAASLRPGRSTAPPPPPLSSAGSEWTVMGLHGRSVLVLLSVRGVGEGQPAAVQVPLTGGVAEVAELFRKVAGAALPPPALPLEPPLPTSSSSASPAEAPSVVEAEQVAVPVDSMGGSKEEAAASAAASAEPGEEEEATVVVAESAAQDDGLQDSGPPGLVPELASSEAVPGTTDSAINYDQHDVSPLSPSAPPSMAGAAASTTAGESAGLMEDDSVVPLEAAAAVRTHSASASVASSASVTPATSELSRQARVQQHPRQASDVPLRSVGDAPPPTRSTAPSTAPGSASSSPPLASLPPHSVLAPPEAPRSTSASALNAMQETNDLSAPATEQQEEEGEEETPAAVTDGSEALPTDAVPAVTPTLDVSPAADEVVSRGVSTPHEPSHGAPDGEISASQHEGSAADADAALAAAAAAGAATVVLVEAVGSESVADACAEGLGLHAVAAVVETTHREGSQSEEASLDAVDETPHGSQTVAAGVEPRIIVTEPDSDPAARASSTSPPPAHDLLNGASRSADAFSMDHTPSMLPTPSQSLPQPSQAHQLFPQPPRQPPTAGGENVVEVGERERDESVGMRDQTEVSPEASRPVMDGILYATPQARQPPHRHMPNPVVPAVSYAPHGVASVPLIGPATGAARVPTAAAAPPAPSALVQHLPVPAIPIFVSPTAAAPPAVVAAPSPLTASYSPSPAGPADGHTAPRPPPPPPGHVTSYQASRSPDAGAAAVIAPPRFSVATSFTPPTPTPFTSFLKAYAIFVLENYIDDAQDSRGGVPGAIGVGKYTGSPRGPASSLPPVTGLAPLLNFYRERPLLRIAAATECQRRCRAAWEAAGTAVAARTNVQLRKLRSSATSAVFGELCVDELVAVLSMVPHLPPPPL